MWFCRSGNRTDCSCDNNKEYEIKLKCMKTKLHSRYITCIAVGIVIWLLATGQANTSEFSAWISFASTIASIILSVIAIIMSITGESKTDAMRNQMEETANKLEETARSIEIANKQNIKNIEELKENIDKLQEKVEQYKGETVEALRKFEKKPSEVDNDRMKINKNYDIRWVKVKDE